MYEILAIMLTLSLSGERSPSWPKPPHGPRMNLMDKTKQKRDVDPRTFRYQNSMPHQIVLFGYETKPPSLLQGIHFGTTAPVSPPVLLGNERVPMAVRIPLTPSQLLPQQYHNTDCSTLSLLTTCNNNVPLNQPDYPNIEDQANSSDEDTVRAILAPNPSMSSPLFVPGTPIPPNNTPTGTLAYTLPPAAGFLQIQGWTKLGTAINLSNLVENSRENLRNKDVILLPPVLSCGAAKNERERCWSTDAITFFIIPFNPKPLSYLTTIHKLTHPDTEAGARGVTGVVQIAIQNSPEAIAFITANRDAISSSFSEEQAIASIVNSVEVRKMDLIVAGGHKERTWVFTTQRTTNAPSAMALTIRLPFAPTPLLWDGMDQSLAQQVVSILPQWSTLMPFKSSTFNVPLLARPEQTKDMECEVDLEDLEDLEDPEASEEAGGSTMDCTSD
ncbi:hypothetical protein EDD18DRAFT_1112324 [Armillaria luteobubalina]|uniref:Uncharacterized protein n=1 Tax=Armillaria luteobubalina TaxID=153913 RepID=A0AA39PGB2_9AGAR|nr:hypothetical protein EDD18DRAFT_1112324 [Armillaria luteobubalina]